MGQRENNPVIHGSASRVVVQMNDGQSIILVAGGICCEGEVRGNGRGKEIHLSTFARMGGDGELFPAD